MPLLKAPRRRRRKRRPGLSTPSQSPAWGRSRCRRPFADCVADIRIPMAPCGRRCASAIRATRFGSRALSDERALRTPTRLTSSCRRMSAAETAAQRWRKFHLASWCCGRVCRLPTKSCKHQRQAGVRRGQDHDGQHRPHPRDYPAALRLVPGRRALKPQRGDRDRNRGALPAPVWRQDDPERQQGQREGAMLRTVLPRP